MLAATIVAIILSYAKQVKSFAFIIIGVCGGLLVEEIINTNVMTAFVDVGITLLLFMAGMEVITGLITFRKLLLINGLDNHRTLPH